MSTVTKGVTRCRSGEPNAPRRRNGLLHPARRPGGRRPRASRAARAGREHGAPVCAVGVARRTSEPAGPRGGERGVARGEAPAPVTGRVEPPSSRSRIRSTSRRREVVDDEYQVVSLRPERTSTARASGARVRSNGRRTSSSRSAPASTASNGNGTGGPIRRRGPDTTLARRASWRTASSVERGRNAQHRAGRSSAGQSAGGRWGPPGRAGAAPTRRAGWVRAARRIAGWPAGCGRPKRVDQLGEPGGGGATERCRWRRRSRCRVDPGRQPGGGERVASRFEQVLPRVARGTAEQALPELADRRSVPSRGRMPRPARMAASAVRSTFPLGVTGNRSSRGPRRAPSPPAGSWRAGPAAAGRVHDRWPRAAVTCAVSTDGRRSRDTTRRGSHLGLGEQRGFHAAQPDPKPRTLTSSSSRPRWVNTPPLVRTRSPVRYHRFPPMVTNRSPSLVDG